MAHRLIRDGLLESEAVLSLPCEGRWLFVSILLSADDLGLFEATAFKLARRSDLKREMVDAILPMLVDRDLVRLYQGPGMRTFGFVPRFGQRLRLKRLKNPMPPEGLLAGDDDAISKIKHLASESADTCQQSAAQRREMRPEPEPEPLNTVSKTSSSHPPGGGSERPKPKPGTAAFDAFWQEWPKSERKQDKAKCLDFWLRNLLDQQADQILADVRVKRGTRKWQEGYVEAPLVYLRGRRWLDGVTPDTGDPGVSAKPWHDTRSGIAAKAKELGVGEWDEYAFSVGRGESFGSYRARVMAAAGVTT